MGTAVRPAKMSPAPWDAFADVDAFVDAALAELKAMAEDGSRPMRSGPKPPLAGTALRKAVMAEGSLLVVATDVVQAPNDKQQLQPMLSKLDALPDELGKVTTLLADTGYFSAANVSACAATEIEPLIAMERQAHYPPLNERFADAPEAADNPTPVEAMAHRLQTPAGRKLYALRKQIPEPVFGLIKSAMGFRQFLLRGLDGVRGEWSLVTMAWNMKRLFVLSPA